MSDVLTSVATNPFESEAQNLGINKVIKISPNNVGLLSVKASSVSSSNCNFRVPISRNQLLSRKLILEMPLSLTVVGTSKIRHFGSCVKSDVLNRLITNLIVRINGGAVISNPQSIVELVQFYDRDTSDYKYGSLSLAPNVPDRRVVINCPQFGDANFLSLDSTTFSETDAENGADERLFHFRSSAVTDPQEPSRGSFPFTQTGGATVTGNTATAQTVVRTYVCLVSLKNPILSGSDYETLCNISDLEIQMSFDAEPLKKCFLHTVLKMGDETGDPTVSCTLSTDATKYVLHGRVYTPSSIDAIPSVQLVPAQRFVINDYDFGTLNSTTTTTPVSHPTIRSPIVPEGVFITCMLRESAKTDLMGDIYANISSLNVRINSKPQDFQSYTTQDFYHMCCRNGLKQRFYDFTGLPNHASDDKGLVALETGHQTTVGVGMVLYFKVSNDFSGELKENLSSSDFQLDISYSALQVSGSNLPFTSRVGMVFSSVYTIEADKPIQVIDGISVQEYDQALSQGQVVSIMEEGHDGHMMVGSGFLRDFGRGFKKGWKMVMKPASQIAQAVAPAFGQDGQMVASTLGVLSNLGGGQLGAGKLGGAQLSRQEQLRRAGLAI